MVRGGHLQEFARSRMLSETGFGSNGHFSAFTTLHLRYEESWGRSYCIDILITMDIKITDDAWYLCSRGASCD